MAKFHVVHGSIQATKDGLVGVGGVVELSEEQAKALLASGLIVNEAKFAALKKQAEGALESGADPLTLSKAVRNVAGTLPAHEAKPAAKPVEHVKK